MVSVIIPVYNAAPYLMGCLNSVVGQSQPDLQILLIDDGSTDASPEICKAFAEKDTRIQFVSQSNSGVSTARNRGLSLAVGEYLLFVDADDELPETAVSMLLKAAGPDIDLVIGSHEEFRGKIRRKIHREERIFSQSQWKEAFPGFDAMLSTLWGKLYRRQVILEHSLSFDPALPYCEDHVFNLRFCREIRAAAVITPVTYRYRLGGIASSLRYYPNMDQYNLALLREYQVFFDGRVPEAFWKQKVRDQLLGSILHEIQHGTHRQAVAGIERILIAYAPFLNGEILDRSLYSAAMARAIAAQDAEKILALQYKEKAASILRKKGKTALWRWYHKRI